MERVVIVGLGGIGSNLVEPLCRTLAYANNINTPKRVILIDGKAYKERNRERQRFSSLANKAETTCDWLRPLFHELTIESKPHFVDSSNILALIREKDIVFLGCDNHATRKLFSDHMSMLDDCLLLSGGNELYDGNVQIYERRHGIDVTPPLIFLHPEIETPKDRNPAELSCEQLSEAGELQILSVNFTVASLMLNAYVLWCKNDSLPYNEIYFDVKTGNVRPCLITR